MRFWLWMAAIVATVALVVWHFSRYEIRCVASHSQTVQRCIQEGHHYCHAYVERVENVCDREVWQRK